MNTFRRILIVSALAAMAMGVANATTIAYSTIFPAGAPATQDTTDYNYTLTLPDFNSALGTLTGVELILFASDTVSQISISNLGTVAQTSFSVTGTSSIANNTTNKLTDSATGLGVFSGTSLDLFFVNNISLGGDSSPTNVACPTGTPSTSCDAVSYGAQPTDTVINDPNGYTITNGTFINGIGLSQTALLADYIGAGTFNLSGSTFGSTTISGAGSIAGALQSVGYVAAEVDYTYAPNNGTPEPTTLVLFGSALVGLGCFRKRIRKSQSK